MSSKTLKDGPLPYAWADSKPTKLGELRIFYSRMEDFGLIEIDEDEIEKTRGTCSRCLRPVKVCLCEYIGIFIIQSPTIQPISHRLYDMDNITRAIYM